MKKYLLLVLGLAPGCGDQGPAPPASAPPPTPPAAISAPAATPKAPAQASSRQDDLYPLRLSLLQARLGPGSDFYLHDPRMDPDGKLGERPHPLRDIYRPEGRYLMRFSRRGYKPVDIAVQLTARGPEPALEAIPLAFQAGEELAGKYREAEESLAAGDARKARAALERVRELDERYDKTEELLRRLSGLETRLEQEKKAQDEALAGLRRGELEAAEKMPSLASDVREARAARQRFEEAVARFDRPGAETELGRLRETLTPADPANRDRAARLDDLKALLVLLEGYEQICLDPRGIRERMTDLWDKEAADRMAEMVRDLGRFARHAKFLTVRHEPRSFTRKGEVAEVRARLVTRFSLPAGESQSDGTVVVTFRKTDSWRIAGYSEAK